jgi:hypothetical protein
MNVIAKPRFVMLMLAITVLASAASGYQSGSRKLFEGKTLKGWEGSEKWFRVEDGAIVGGSAKDALSQNEFLCTKEEYSDFELRLKFKLTGESVNGGIQIRSQRIPNNNEVSGYQADLGDSYWGSLYDESRRNKTLVKPDDKLIEKILKRDQWNDYRILCEGPRIRLYVNGKQTVDYTETDASIPLKGIIGLQIHAGKPSEARYKDIVIRTLTAE